MVKKIVSHVKPRHMDDFLAVALLKTKYPDAQIEFLHPQQIPVEYYIDQSICLVDVGGKFEPSLKNYDHHQNLNLKASFVLVLIHEFDKTLVKKIVESQTTKFIDLTDRFGVRKASELTGVPLNSVEDQMRKEILLIDLLNSGVIVGEIALKTLLSFEKYSDWIKEFYSRLDELKLLDEPRAQIAREEALFKQKLAKAQIIHKNEFKILISNETLSPHHFKVFNELEVDIIIERNSMNRHHTSIIKNTSSNKTTQIDLAKIFDLYPKVFIHANKFIAVIDISIDKIDIEKILNLII
jgi:hypothetical protein